MQPKSLAIRDMGPSDLAQIARWQRELYLSMGELNPGWHQVRPPLAAVRKDTREMLEMLRGTGGFVLVAELDGRPAGYLMAEVLPSPPPHFRLLLRPEVTGQIDPVFVEKRSRSRGVGTALCCEAERRLREAGCDTLVLGVVAQNVRAIRLYRSLGLEPMGIRMTKRLGPTPRSWKTAEARSHQVSARLRPKVPGGTRRATRPR